MLFYLFHSSTSVPTQTVTSSNNHFVDCQFSNLQARAFEVDVGNFDLTVDHCSFTEIAFSGEGALFSIESQVSPIFTSCTVSNCSAGDVGGAFKYMVTNANTHPSFSSTSISGCHSDDRVIYLQGDKVSEVQLSYVNLTECYLTDNKGTDPGLFLFCDVITKALYTNFISNTGMKYIIYFEQTPEGNQIKSTCTNMIYETNTVILDTHHILIKGEIVQFSSATFIGDFASHDIFTIQNVGSSQGKVQLTNCSIEHSS